jgi:O-antigen/teichoic acid export membrane protein
VSGGEKIVENKDASEPLRQRTVRGASWSFLDQGVGFATQFVIGVVLARLLQPEDFGLLGMAWIVMGFGAVFVYLGLGPALIQRRHLTERHIRVAFTVSAVAGVCISLAVMVAAPLAAQALGDERVTPLLRVTSIILVCSGLQIPSQALLQRRLDFRRIFYVNVANSAVHGLTAIGLAVSGFGVWSLVCGMIAQRVGSLILYYVSVQHSIKPLIARNELKELASFGVGVSLAQIFNYFALQGDYFVVGRVLGSSALGVYTRAYSLMQMPTQRFVGVLSRTLFPAVSIIQDDQRRFRSAYLRTLTMIAFITLPALLLLVITAPELIVGVYGKQWAGAVLPLQILGVFGLFRAMYHGAAAFLRAKGWVYRILVCQVVYGNVLFGGTWLAASRTGLAGATVAVGFSILLMWFLIMYFGAKAANVGPVEVIKTLQPGIVLAIPLGLSAVGSRYILMHMLDYPLLILGGVLLCSTLVGISSLFIIPQHWLRYLPHEVLKVLNDVIPRCFVPGYRRLSYYFKPIT